MKTKISKIETPQFGTNVYLLETAKNIIVIDPGEAAQSILAAAQKIGKPIVAVLLTHAHYDHVGAVAPLQTTGARVYLHEEDFKLVGKSGYVFGSVSPDALLKGSEQELQFDTAKIKMLHTPGHSAGSVCYIIDDNMFTGDTIFKHEIGRCDLPSGNLNTMKKTLKSLLDIYRVDGIEYKVLPGHGDSSTLSSECKFNPYAE